MRRRISAQFVRAPMYVLIAGAVLVLVLIGYPFGVTLWDWAKLLLVPAILAAGGLWFNAQQAERAQKLADQRTQDDALQAYLDQMAQLLKSEFEESDKVRTLARARTLTVLGRLDGERKRSVVQFLYESGVLDATGEVLSLAGADLRGADLSYSHLTKAQLRRADLRGADLSVTNLHEADLSGANLEGANLRGTHLRGANLSGTNLTRADLTEAALHGAVLGIFRISGQYLSGQDLSETELMGKDLSRTLLLPSSLLGANVTDSQLAQCQSLEGIRMPNGQNYEDWLETPRGRNWLKIYRSDFEEDRENSNFS
jgi:uncharacterized protein YjbI with pentapeptide repeats